MGLLWEVHIFPDLDFEAIQKPKTVAERMNIASSTDSRLVGLGFRRHYRAWPLTLETKNSPFSLVHGPICMHGCLRNLYKDKSLILEILLWEVVVLKIQFNCIHISDRKVYLV